MNKFKLIATWLLLVVLAAPTSAQQALDQSTVEQQKIDWLIDSVATLHDTRFIRNGQAYDATRAADHLRLKLRFAGDRVKYRGAGIASASPTAARSMRQCFCASDLPLIRQRCSMTRTDWAVIAARPRTVGHILPLAWVPSRRHAVVHFGFSARRRATTGRPASRHFAKPHG